MSDIMPHIADGHNRKDRMKKRTCLRRLSVGLFAVFVLFRPAARHLHAQPAPSGFAADAGAEFRIRYDYKDNRPSPGGVQTTQYHDYFRFRTRVWLEAGYENVTLYSRFANEWRAYHNAKQQRAFPDEGFIDSLYLDIAGLADTVDLRVGRQEIRYGAGRLFREGTAGDASRAWWFDGAVADVRFTETSKLSLFGVYQRPEDDWTLGNEYYDLTARTGGGPNDLTEAAAGAYFTGGPATFPFDLYLIWKDESRYFRNGTTRTPGRDFFTLGARLAPSFSPRLSAETETALQAGRTDDGRDILAALAYAGATAHLAPDDARKPYLTGACLWLSGDQNPDRGTDHNWNPVFNRTVWFSELTADQYGKYLWANLLYPHAEAGFSPAPGHKASLQAGPLFATHRDTAQDSRHRAWLYVFRYQFPFLKGFLREASGVRANITAEVFDAGDYYARPDTAYFFSFFLTVDL
jgi:hypothetical protein